MLQDQSAGDQAGGDAEGGHRFGDAVAQAEGVQGYDVSNANSS